jgi:hypothetical protein
MEEIKKDNKGYIYCMSNSHIPDYVKVGFTTRDDLELREKELSNATGVLGKYKTQYYIECEDVIFYEKRIHEEIVKRGFERYEKKELFKCKPEDIEKIFTDFCRKEVYKNEKKEMETVTDIKDSVTKENSNEDKDENKKIEIKTFKEYLEKSEEANKYYKNGNWSVKDIVITNKSKLSIWLS